MKIVPPEDGQLSMVVYGVYHEDEGPDAIRYVGKTERRFSERVSAHRTEAHAPSFAWSKRPILMFHRKYGQASTFRLLGVADTAEALVQLEIQMISKYDTYHGRRGLNCTMGGEGATGYRVNRGEAHHSSVLSDNEAREIYELVSMHEFTQDEIATAYGVSKQTVTSIIQGKTYGNLELPPMESQYKFRKHTRGARNTNAKLTDDSVLEIHSRYESGEGAADLGAEFGVDRNTILTIVGGKGWGHLSLPSVTRAPVDPPPQTGELNQGAKMTNDSAIMAYNMCLSGTPASSVARQMGVRVGAINNLITGKSWKHLGLEPFRIDLGRNEKTGRLESKLIPPQ